MRIKAYPKINLCLKVFKETDCGKHKIDSIFYLYKQICDKIKITKNSNLSISYKLENEVLNFDDCLVTKSMIYMHNKYGIDVNYKIVIKKNIPLGCGFGGGSSDAAAIINFLIKKNPNLNIKLDLKEIAATLGSDIPFFLTGYQTARVTSIGDNVCKSVCLKPQIEVLIPKLKCETKKIFDLLSQDNNYQSLVNVDQILESYIYKQHLNNVVYNDLTKYIIQKITTYYTYYNL